ncbi:MAG: peptide chain release factor 2 [Candidatus Omnitrophica bacterium]|nr:peptide chain release factor 2 [Candidatus Omnitrophota bacterium]
MYEEMHTDAADILERLEELGGHLDVAGKLKIIGRLEKEMNAPGFWNNPQSAQEHGKKIKSLKNITDAYSVLHSHISDLQILIEMAREENESGHEEEFQQELQTFHEHFDDFEMRCTLSGDHDDGNCFVNIHPGAGGTESCDWASMLFRMYMRYFERMGWKAEVVDYLDGEEAGVKNVTIHVKGEYAYGYMQAENGIHRLVRISPFDANSRRHTSFSAVHVMPEIDDSIDVDIDEKDLRIDTFRSSGKGGQHVNTTDSAIRITHLPTGIVVSCQNERSQRQNRMTAMKILSSRLFEMMQAEHAEKVEELSGEKRNIAWGNQIRSYVFHPYNMIKDHRTGHERGDIQNVMDGDLHDYITDYLQFKIHGGKPIEEIPVESET